MTVYVRTIMPYQDYYENHVSVQTRGFRFNISANHSYALATTNRIPDLTDGIHTVRPYGRLNLLLYVNVCKVFPLR